MRLETILDESAKQTLVDLMLKGQEVLIFSKNWGAEGLDEVHGDVYGIHPGILIDFLKDGENDYRHFCGPTHGIVLISGTDGKTQFYKNMKVLEVSKEGYLYGEPVKDAKVKAEILKAGVFYIHPEYLPKEIRF